MENKVEPKWGYAPLGEWVMLNREEYEEYRRRSGVVESKAAKINRASKHAWLFGRCANLSNTVPIWRYARDT